MLLKTIRTTLDGSRANAANHPFFKRFEEPKTPEQLRKFAIQWYSAARNHKLAFPHLVALVEDDSVRFGLIEILRDEYGNGDPAMIHARLLKKFLVEGLGITEKEVNEPYIVPEIEAFGKITLASWRINLPEDAYGYHYALEYIAQGIHKVFFRGLQNHGLSEDVLAYFRYHSTAEEEHTQITERGLRYYAENLNNHELIMRGVERGERALHHMWNGFHDYVFGN